MNAKTNAAFSFPTDNKVNNNKPQMALTSDKGKGSLNLTHTSDKCQGLRGDQLEKIERNSNLDQLRQCKTYDAEI